MATVEATQTNFEQLVHDHDFVIVDFWAPWCGPCRAFAPVYEQVSERHPDIVFAKVNTEQERELAAHFHIRSIPTIMVFRERTVVFAQPAALPAVALEKLIEAVRELDMDEVRRDLAAREARKEQPRA